MKRNTKTLLFSILFAIVMLVVVMPTTALAAGEVINFNTWVKGVQITSDNMSDVLGDGKISYIPAQYGAPAKLILNGATISASDYKSGIEIREDLIIEIKGNNTVISTDYIGIDSFNKLYIQSDGTGNLTVSSAEFCIRSEGDIVHISGLNSLNVSIEDQSFESIRGFEGLTISDCNTVTSNSHLDSCNGDMLLQNGEFNISQPSLDINSNEAIYSLQYLTINNATIEITPYNNDAIGNFKGIYAQEDILISADSDITITNAKSGIRGSATVTINSSNVNISATDYTIQSLNTDGIVLDNCAIDTTNTPVHIATVDSIAKVLNSDDSVATAVEINLSDSLSKYTVAVTSSNNAWGTVNVLGLDNDSKVKEGANVTLRANANSGYRFVGWKKGGDDSIVSDEIVYNPTITADTTYQAVFSDEFVYDTVVCGTQVNSLNKDDVLGDGKVSYTPAYGSRPAKLTLNGVTLSYNGGSALDINEDLTIEIIGTNTVTSTSGTAIYTEGNLFFESDGTGSLTVNAHAKGVQSRLGRVSFSGLASLNVITDNIDMEAVYTFAGLSIIDCVSVTVNNQLHSGNGGVDYESMYITNSTVNIKMPNKDTDAIKAMSYLYITDSEIVIEPVNDEAKNTFDAIYSQQDITIEDSDITILDAKIGIYGDDLWIRYSRISVSASEYTILGNGDDNDVNYKYISFTGCDINTAATPVKLLTVVDERPGWGDITDIVNINNEEIATEVLISPYLESVEVQNVVKPMPGQELNLYKDAYYNVVESVPAGKGYRFYMSTWEDITGGDIVALSDGDTFEGGHTYRYTVKLQLTYTDFISEYLFPDPMYLAFSLAGLDYASGDYAVPSKEVDGDILTVKVLFECPAIYTVTFKDGGGSGTMDPVTVEAGEYTLPECTFGPINEGYEFKAWAFNSNVGEQLQPGIKINITGDVRLYAVWQKKSYTITAVSEDESKGTVTGSGTFEYSTQALLTATPKEGYVFEGWYQDGERVTGSISRQYFFVSEDATYTAKFTRADDIITAANAVIDIPVTGANPDMTPEASNPDKYTVTFYKWYDSSYNEMSAGDTFEGGKEYELRVVFEAKEGYEFEGTTFTVNGEATEDFVDENPYSVTRRKIKFQVSAAATYPVTINGGTFNVGGASSGEYAPNSVIAIVANAPATGKQFKEWISEDVSFADATASATSFRMPAKSVTITATYEDIPVTTYTVSFNANGGTGTMADVTGVSGEYTLPANRFTAPSGMQFKAWSVNGSQKVVGAKITVTANTTVTAVWESIPEPPVYDDDDDDTEEITTGWYKDAASSRWYYYDNNGNMVTGWLQDTDGKWYYMSGDGAMVANGWYKDETSYRWYYLDADGSMKTDWHLDSDGKWYFLSTDGAMIANGWHKDEASNRWYYLGASGAMVTGWFTDVDGKKYYLDKSSGAMVTGWFLDSDGKWYYFDKSGALYTNGTTPDGYKVDENGAWIEE